DATGSGSWSAGGSFSSAPIGIILSATAKALEIHSETSGDINWTRFGYDISMGRNTFYVPGGYESFIISTYSDDAIGHQDHNSGVEALNGVFSLAYGGVNSLLRWNGDSHLTGTMRLGSGLSTYFIGGAT